MHESGEQISFERPKEGFRTEEGVQAYLCKNCGAELITEDTTTAAECPYCGSPTILPDRIEGGVKPEKVIPFVVTKEQAQKQFEDYFKGKRLLPNIFLNGRNRISEMRRLYVPYWLFSCDACADMVYDAEKVRTEKKGEWEITCTKHYLVRRKGGMRFENIPVDGSVRLDDRITESLEPYDLSAAIPFQSAVLVGIHGVEALHRVAGESGRAILHAGHGYTQILAHEVEQRIAYHTGNDGATLPVLEAFALFGGQALVKTAITHLFNVLYVDTKRETVASPRVILLKTEEAPVKSPKCHLCRTGRRASGPCSRCAQQGRAP